MSEVTVVLDATDKPAVRCFKKNAHVVLKLDTISIVLTAALLPRVRDAIVACLSKVQSTSSDPFASLRAQMETHSEAIKAMFTAEVFVSIIVRNPDDPTLRIVFTNDDSIDGIRSVLDSPGNVEIFPAKSKE